MAGTLTSLSCGKTPVLRLFETRHFLDILQSAVNHVVLDKCQLVFEDKEGILGADVSPDTAVSLYAYTALCTIYI